CLSKTVVCDGVEHCFDGSDEAKSMTSLDMSRVALREIDLGVFALFPNLKSLNLSQCGVKRAVRDNITLLSELRWLDLSGCP
ncbi:hypothetical protein BaRGS_00032357, partial [Batillaria attramentaria]